MRRLAGMAIYLIWLITAALGHYELTAKSPLLLGRPLPGWPKTLQVERMTRWDPPTGILPVDKLLHEGEEAARFYGLLAHHGG